VVGRFLVGLGIGASAIVVPAYLAEIAPAAKRGAVVQTYEVRLVISAEIYILCRSGKKTRVVKHVLFISVSGWVCEFHVEPAYLAEIATAAKRGAVVQTCEVRLLGISG
jgi:hypothetical protein